jgi:hypothetical protein
MVNLTFPNCQFLEPNCIHFVYSRKISHLCHAEFHAQTCSSVEVYTFFRLPMKAYFTMIKMDCGGQYKAEHHPTKKFSAKFFILFV